MSEPIRSGYVNWIDGMKMSRGHFVDLQRAIEDRIRDERAHTSWHLDHGLLHGRHNGKPALDYEVVLEGRDTFTLRVRQCRAVTAGGGRIEILHGEDPEGALPALTATVGEALMQEGASFDLLVAVDSLDMEPYGVPNALESPPRHPWARPRCTLGWAATDDLRAEGYGLHHVAIARLKVVRNELAADTEYLPPCVSVSALPRLEEFHAQYHRFLKEAEQNLFKIVICGSFRKNDVSLIVIRLNMREKRTDLSDSVDTYCRAAIGFLERELGSFQTLGHRMGPRQMVTNAVSFARTVRYTIELLTGKGKDELLNYMSTVITVQPAEYLRTLSRLTDLEYHHTDLKDSLTRILDFCRVHRKLLDEWVRLDYIGQRKTEDIFIHAETGRPPPPPPPPKRGWSF